MKLVIAAVVFMALIASWASPPPMPGKPVVAPLQPVPTMPVARSTNQVLLEWDYPTNASNVHFLVMETTDLLNWDQVDDVMERSYVADAVSPGSTFWRVAATTKLPLP